jgi:hypothetical protein
MSSTELIQEEETADEDDERNPEVDIGGDGAKQTWVSSGFGSGRHCHLRLIVQTAVSS